MEPPTHPDAPDASAPNDAPDAPENARQHPTSEDLEVSSYLEATLEGEPRPEAPPPPPLHPQTVIVLDFGSQLSMLIARRIREAGVYSSLVPYDAPWEDVRDLNPAGFILSGGPASVYDDDAPQVPAYVFDSGLPILGICYGMQLLAYQLGGKVEPSAEREYGHAVIHHASDSPLFEGLPASLPVWMSHGDRITGVPPGFQPFAHSDSSPIAAMANGSGYIGIQFHPEVIHTRDGKAILENFLLNVCGCAGDWSAGNFIADSISRIRGQVGEGRVICALSGGVDSAVTAALVHRAIGDQLTCVFVNNGLLRKDEPERVVDTFHRHLKMNLIHTDSEDRFLDALTGVTDPEQKRKIIGETFIRIFEQEADRLFPQSAHPDALKSAHSEALEARPERGRSRSRRGPSPQTSAHPEALEGPTESPLARATGEASPEQDNGPGRRGPGVRASNYIAQGTTYPDVIESGAHAAKSKVAATIKTHHNVGGLPSEMTFQLVEPLRYLFKDEVRKVGLELGLPEEIVMRQPFPGPGLAIRIIGDVTREKLHTLRECDWIVMNEIKKAGLYHNLWQAFAILTDTRSVGVMGDFRTYGHVVAIRAVTAEDAMTADWARLPYDLLARISNRIVNEVPSVNRVVYDITSKPPGTIEWE